MARLFCHECSYEGTDFSTSHEGFVCPRCGGSFCEEIPEGDQAGDADDPRAFDPAAEQDEEPFAGLFGGGLRRVNSSGQQQGQGQGQRGGNGNFIRYRSPGGGFVFTGGFGGGSFGGGLGGAAGSPPPAAGSGPAANPLVHSLMQAFGLAPPAQGPYGAAPAIPGGRPAARRWQSAGAIDPAQQQRNTQQAQVPIQNLATFLSDAFGGNTHPADDPMNNPFAEGGHEQVSPGTEEQEREREARDRAGSPAGIGSGAQQHPLGALFSLFGHVLGAPGGFGMPMHGDAGDYVWGSEANFQQLLNDLMEQAAGRAGPQPAPDDMIEKLPRLKVTQEVLDMDSITTCGVCLDSFQLDDAAIALPCKHVYHEDCLVPWLKTSGTCPTCRHALVPQPGQPGYGEEEGGGAAAAQAGADSAAAPEASGSTSSERPPSDALPPRPPMSTRPSSTAHLPEIAGGSTLPGSWVWPSGAGDSDAEEPNPWCEEHNASRDAEGDVDMRDPEEVPLPGSVDAPAGPSGGGGVLSEEEEEAPMPGYPAMSAGRAAAEAAERRHAAAAAAPAEEEERSKGQPESMAHSAPGSSATRGENSTPRTRSDASVQSPPIEDVD